MTFAEGILRPDTELPSGGRHMASTFLSRHGDLDSPCLGSMQAMMRASLLETAHHPDHFLAGRWPELGTCLPYPRTGCMQESTCVCQIHLQFPTTCWLTGYHLGPAGRTHQLPGAFACPNRQWPARAPRLEPVAKPKHYS